MHNVVESALAKARRAERRGDAGEAERHYAAVLARFPRNPKALKGLEHIRAIQGRGVARHAPPQPLPRPLPDPAPIHDLEALARLHDAGAHAEAAALGEELAARYPGSLLAHNLLGIVYIGLSDWSRASVALERAVALDGARAGVFNNLALALTGAGRHHEAIAAARHAIALDASYVTAHNTLGNALKAAGRFDEAIRAYARALELRPDYADAANNLGIAHQLAGDHDAAIAAYARAIALVPDHAAAFNNLGSVLAEGGRDAEAMDAFARAAQLAPLYAESWCNLGGSLKRLGRLDEALAALDRSVTIAPGNAAAHNERGNVLVLQGHLDQAVAAYERSLAITPGEHWVLGNLVHYRATICDWSPLPGLEALRGAGHDGAGPADEAGQADDVAQPFSLLTLDDDPARQLATARAWAGARLGGTRLLVPARAAQPGERIRVGYFSADFHDHATMHLMAGLLREHDRAAFEIRAYSYGPAIDDPMRRYARAHVDAFADIRDLSDAAAAELARADGLDIAVDLKGNTFESRSRLFARGLAPVQMSYLGFPGTMGAGFIDYLIADAVVIPESERCFYSEKIITLPGSYQANDNLRPPVALGAEASGTRSDHGLPPKTAGCGFVFCCFNQNYKISPREWDIWMRLLARVPGSVLWLARSNVWAEASLRREAGARGVDASRLVFAERLPQAEHLARQVHADLFLDTFAVNAHTTASDALWAGLPVLTLAGRAFAARVAASLLSAIGLPDLVTESEAAYEARALELAREPEALAELRARLTANRLTHPLFDTPAHARAIEAAYRAAVERARAGLPPDHLVIA